MQRPVFGRDSSANVFIDLKPAGLNSLISNACGADVELGKQVASDIPELVPATDEGADAATRTSLVLSFVGLPFVKASGNFAKEVNSNITMLAMLANLCAQGGGPGAPLPATSSIDNIVVSVQAGVVSGVLLLCKNMRM